MKKKSTANSKNVSQSIAIVASCFGGPKSALVRSAVQSGADLIEVRLDTWPKASIVSIYKTLKDMRQKIKTQWLLTIRSPKEQGPQRKEFQKYSDSERWELYKELLPLFDWIDVELNHESLAKKCVSLAHQNHKKVILSSHFFSRMPNSKEIFDRLKKFKKLNGDCFKIAGMPHTLLDTLLFMEQCSRLKNIPRCFIAMGERGQISRHMGFLVGCSLTYAAAGRLTAPGQPHSSRSSKNTFKRLILEKFF